MDAQSFERRGGDVVVLRVIFQTLQRPHDAFPPSVEFALELYEFPGARGHDDVDERVERFRRAGTRRGRGRGVALQDRTRGVIERCARLVVEFRARHVVLVVLGLDER